MSTALTTTSLNDMELGNVLARSGYFKDARDASQAVVKVLFGREIGIGPVSAMMGIHIIEGKPAPSANLIAARIKSSGRYDYRVREHTTEACRLEFFERDSKGGRESLGVVEWTMDDAKRAGLTGKAGSPWQKYPRAMLFARAISEGARVHAPELFGGAPVYTPEELGAEVDAEGNAVVISSEPLPAAPAESNSARLGRLNARYFALLNEAIPSISREDRHALHVSLGLPPSCKHWGEEEYRTAAEAVKDGRAAEWRAMRDELLTMEVA
jgi:hypothetical protein